MSLRHKCLATSCWLSPNCSRAWRSLVPIDNVTGTFFHKQTVESLVEVLASFDEQKYDPQTIHNHALEFDQPRFHRRILQFIEAKMSEGKTRDVRTPSSELIR